jgi:hypothetical protein
MFSYAGLLGNPDDCRKMIRQLHEFGVDELACLIDFGLTDELVMQGLDPLTRLREEYDAARIGRDHYSYVVAGAGLLHHLCDDPAAIRSLNSVKGIFVCDNKMPSFMPGMGSITVPLMSLQSNLATTDVESLLWATPIDKAGKVGVSPATGMVNTVLNEEFE